MPKLSVANDYVSIPIDINNKIFISFETSSADKTLDTITIMQGKNIDTIRLNNDGKISLTTKGSGTISNQTGLSVSTVAKLNEIISNPSSTAVGSLAMLRMSKNQFVLEDYGYLLRELIKDGGSNISEERAKNALLKLKEYGTLDDVLNAYKIARENSVAEAKKKKEIMTKVKELYEAGDIDGFNQYLLAQEVEIVFDKKGRDSDDILDGNEDLLTSDNLGEYTQKLEVVFDEFFNGTYDAGNIDRYIVYHEKRLEEANTEELKTKFEAYIKSLGIDPYAKPVTKEGQATSEAKAVGELHSKKDELKNTKVDIDNLEKQKAKKQNELANATTDAQKIQLSNEINVLETDIASKNAQMTQIKQEQAKAVEKVAKAIIVNTNNAISQNSKDILTAMASISSNEAVVNIVLQDKDEIIKTVEKIENSITTSVSSVSSSVSVNNIRQNSSLATNTRLAKLSNPYNDNLALAYAISNIVNDKFASGNDGALSSVVKSYTDRFNHDNNIWASIIGARGKIDSGTTKLYGFNIGYDKAFDNAIVGGFMTYAKAKAKDDGTTQDTDLYQVGTYGRIYVGQSEIDVKANVGKTKNDRDRLGSEAKFNGTFFDLSVDYGYVFDVTKGVFVKPIVGLNYSNMKNNAFTENGGLLPLNFNKNISKILTAKAAVEFRKYIENGSYFYITPGYERELSKSIDDTEASFVGSTYKMNFKADKNKKGYAVINTGADFKVNDSLKINLDFGIKAKKDERYFNGTLGVRYSF